MIIILVITVIMVVVKVFTYGFSNSSTDKEISALN